MQGICQQLWPKLPEPAELDPLAPGSTDLPAFDAEGHVQGAALQQALQRDRTTLAQLSHCFMTSQEYQQSEVAPAVLPIARQDQRESTTTSASIMLLKGPRQELLALTMGSDMLWAVVQGIRAQHEKEEYLDECVVEFMLVGGCMWMGLQRCHCKELGHVVA